MTTETGLARLDPQALISKALETGAGIETMERLVALAREVRQIQAREAWYAAMADFQAACPPIHKTKKAQIQTARGQYTYTYAPLDEILSVIQPVMGKVGLSCSWSMELTAQAATAEAKIAHTMGHSESSGKVTIPIVLTDPEKGANPAQRVGIAMSYAKRYALLSIIGMAPEDDTDGHQGQREEQRRGEPEVIDPSVVISEAQGKRYYAIARGAGWSDEQLHDLLASYKVGSSKEIPVAQYEAIIDRVKAGPGK